jgi:hypothetical protein
MTQIDSKNRPSHHRRHRVGLMPITASTGINRSDQNIRRQPIWATSPAITRFDELWAEWETDVDDGENPLAMWDFSEFISRVTTARDFIWDYKLDHIGLPKGLRRRHGRVVTISRTSRSSRTTLEIVGPRP